MPLSKLRGLRALAAIALLSTCTSCFTMGLWGFGPEYDEDLCTGRGETVFEYDEHTEWSWGLLGLRLLLTPVTLALDVVTCPLQCVLLGDGDDDCR